MTETEEPRPTGNSHGKSFATPAQGAAGSSLAANIHGATAIEYALIACFVALAVFVGATTTGVGLNSIFAVVGSKTQSASEAAAGTSGN